MGASTSQNNTGAHLEGGSPREAGVADSLGRAMDMELDRAGNLDSTPEAEEPVAYEVASSATVLEFESCPIT